jgi:hypothetical protein
MERNGIYVEGWCFEGIIYFSAHNMRSLRYPWEDEG